MVWSLFLHHNRFGKLEVLDPQPHLPDFLPSWSPLPWRKSSTRVGRAKTQTGRHVPCFVSAQRLTNIVDSCLDLIAIDQEGHWAPNQGRPLCGNHFVQIAKGLKYQSLTLR